MLLDRLKKSIRCESRKLGKQKFDNFLKIVKMTSPRNNGNNETMNGNKEGGEIDREKVCPLLLRVFCATSRHNNLLDYNRGKTKNKTF